MAKHFHIMQHHKDAEGRHLIVEHSHREYKGQAHAHEHMWGYARTKAQSEELRAAYDERIREYRAKLQQPKQQED